MVWSLIITFWFFNVIEQEWSYLRGGLTTLDRDYGWINNIHHDIGTHIIHHLFPQIPHYHLIEAVSISLFWTRLVCYCFRWSPLWDLRRDLLVLTCCFLLSDCYCFIACIDWGGQTSAWEILPRTKEIRPSTFSSNRRLDKKHGKRPLR